MKSRPIILASASPRRRDLLKEYGVKAEIIPAAIEEAAPGHLTAREIALLNAVRKSTAVAGLRPEAIVIGADTLVSLEGKVFGKPADMEEAFEMLSQLNGRWHQVFTAVCLTRKAAPRTHAFIEATRVRFRKWTGREIRDYLKRTEPLDKAGAYAAQDSGRPSIIQKIEGSLTNVVGLPMERLLPALEAFQRGFPKSA